MARVESKSSLGVAHSIPVAVTAHRKLVSQAVAFHAQAQSIVPLKIQCGCKIPGAYLQGVKAVLTLFRLFPKCSAR